MRFVSVLAGVGLVLLLVSAPGFGFKVQAQECTNACTSCNQGETCPLDTDTGQCRCFPLICCNCEPVGNSVCPQTCDGTIIDAAGCIGLCLLANVFNPCNIKVLLLTQCQGNPEACPTTSCCQFDFCTANPEQCDEDELGTIPDQVCIGSNQFQCQDIFGSTFVEDGSCDRITGTCNSPTPTNTPTATPTDTPMATPTRHPDGDSDRYPNADPDRNADGHSDQYAEAARRC